MSQINEKTGGVNLRFERHALDKIPDTEIYIKRYRDGGYDIKNMDYTTMPFVYRVMKGEKPKDSDYYFMHDNGCLAKLMQNPLKGR